METTWDKLRAVGLAVGLHALLIALLFVGLLVQPIPAAADAAGPIVEATLVSSPQQSAAIAKAIKAIERKAPQEATPPPQPKPAPNPEDAQQPPQLAPQAPLPKPDVVNQDEVRRTAELAAAQNQEQEERRKQAQVDLTNQLIQQQQEQNRQRLAQQQLAQQQLADIRKQRADAERQVKLQEQKMKQLQDQAARLAQSDAPPTVAPPGPVRPQSGNAGDKTGLLAKYKKAINEIVQLNWHHDSDKVPERTHCIVQFKQLPGGEVFEVSFPDCPFDAAGRDSVEAALKRTPLPYAGFESVFQPQGKIDMCYPEEACK